MTVLHTPQLDGLIKLLEGVARGVEVVPEVSAPSRRKLAALAKSGRDLLETTPALQQTMVRFANAALRAELQAQRVPTLAAILEAFAKGARAHVLLQSREGGQGHFKKLSDKYAEYKRRKYGNAPITQATKALYGDLARARWVARRK